MLLIPCENWDVFSPCSEKYKVVGQCQVLTTRCHCSSYAATLLSILLVYCVYWIDHNISFATLGKEPKDLANYENKLCVHPHNSSQSSMKAIQFVLLLSTKRFNPTLLELSNKWQLSERAIPMVQFSYEDVSFKPKTLMWKLAMD